MSRQHGRFPRVACLVPGCGCGATCYAPRPGLEIICPKHYRHVDRRLKALRRRCRFLGRKRKIPAWRMDRIEEWLWERMRKQAIWRAAGL